MSSKSETTTLLHDPIRVFRSSGGRPVPGSDADPDPVEPLLVSCGRELRTLHAPRSLHWVARAVLERGEYAIPPLPGYVPTVVVDVGANIGAFALYASLRWPGARLLAFEPSSASFALLARNLAHLPGIALERAALLDRDGSLTLHGGRNNPGESSLRQGAEQVEEGETVRVLRASAALSGHGVEDVSVLKIDTEGSEIPILADLAPLLPRVDFVLLEYHHDDDRRALDARLAPGFLLYGGSVDRPHRGVLKYMRRGLVERDPRLSAFCEAEDRK